MRQINEIIIHCSATKEGQYFDVKDIRRWHLARGWSDVGYHYIVLLDGKQQNGRLIQRAGAHAKGHNSKSIGICYVGGLDVNGSPKDTRTNRQKISLKSLITALQMTFPKAKVIGHRDISSKACPCFDATKEYS